MSAFFWEMLYKADSRRMLMINGEPDERIKNLVAELYAEVPDRVVKIDEYVFPAYEDKDKNSKFVIKCSKGSLAETYAKENGYKCKY